MGISINKKEEFLKAFDDLADKLFNHCYFRVSDREKAKDLVQETFVKCWQHLSKGKDIFNINAFLYKIANNLIIDYYRKQKDYSLDDLREKGFDKSNSGSEEIITQTEFSLVLVALNKMAQDEKEIITWRFVDGFSPKEISEILNVSENVVSVRLNRAMKKLRDMTKKPS